jgi:uncharacterized Zn finger protein
VADRPTDPEDTPEAIEGPRHAEPPACVHCGSAQTAILIRSRDVLYVRCSVCAFLWKQPRTPQTLDDADCTETEHRVDRFTIPLCERCGSIRTEVSGRTPHAVYLRCSHCGDIWSAPKPGAEI